MHVVRGVLKDYDWGVVDGLARWSDGPTGAPQAELWYGVHRAGPATIARGDQTGQRLDACAEHADMPLVKLLAASTPLSLQVHPDAEHARAGWRRQQGDDPATWRYSDDAEKAELLVALTPFEVHAGWRDPAAAASVLAQAGAPTDVVDAVRSGDRVDAIHRMLHLDTGTCGQVCRRLVAAATTDGWSADAVSALARVVATHPDDPGVLVTVLLEHVHLAPGEGIAVPAGVVHSYVAGLGVEVMTSSDNVLRLGLTSKPVAVEEALGAVRSDHAPLRMGGFAGEVLAPPDMPFDLVLADQPVLLASGRHRIVLALHGTASVAGEVLAEGEAAVLAPGEPDAWAEPTGSLVVVTSAALTPTPQEDA